MSTSERGFSLVELLLAVLISVLLALSVAPLWFSLQQVAAEAADDVTLVGQSRVALSRLERDLRLATRTVPELGGVGPILAADASQIVLVVRPLDAGPPLAVEWEIVGSALMRRKGAVSGPLAGPPAHAWYTDHKTMLDGLRSGSGFRYFVGGLGMLADTDEIDCARVKAVLLQGELTAGGSQNGSGSLIRMWGRVAR
jgi:prepilin-type N-terminal cleavage/methylation domain-containing protein